MGNVQPIKGSGSSTPTTPRLEKTPTVNFEEVALGKATGALTEHDQTVPPPKLFGGQTAAFLAGETNQPPVAFGVITRAKGAFQGAKWKCAITGIDPKSSLAGAVLRCLGNAKIKSAGGELKIFSKTSLEELNVDLEKVSEVRPRGLQPCGRAGRRSDLMQRSRRGLKAGRSAP